MDFVMPAVPSMLRLLLAPDASPKDDGLRSVKVAHEVVQPMLPGAHQFLCDLAGRPGMVVGLPTLPGDVAAQVVAVMASEPFRKAMCTALGCRFIYRYRYGIVALPFGDTQRARAFLAQEPDETAAPASSSSFVNVIARVAQTAHQLQNSGQAFAYVPWGEYADGTRSRVLHIAADDRDRLTLETSQRVGYSALIGIGFVAYVIGGSVTSMQLARWQLRLDEVPRM